MKGVAVHNCKCSTIPIYISRSKNVKDLEAKINRILTGYIYIKKQDKSMIIKKTRLWKSKYEEAEVAAKLALVDQKHSNYTHVKINADILNKNEEQRAIKLQDLDVADGDVLVVELPKSNGDFVF